jgi:hypothetical protein
MGYHRTALGAYSPLGLSFGAGSGTTGWITIPAGRWVDMEAAVKNAYTRERGAHVGREITLPTGVTAKRQNVPETTCADIASSFGSWVKDMTTKGMERPGGPWLSHLLGGTNPFAGRLATLAASLRPQCPDPDAVYPHNDEFWALTGRLAIELDSQKAIPSTWQLWKESVAEAATDAVDKVPNPCDLVPALCIDWTKWIAISALGVGAYFALKGR